MVFLVFLAQVRSSGSRLWCMCVYDLGMFLWRRLGVLVVGYDVCV